MRGKLLAECSLPVPEQCELPRHYLLTVEQDQTHCPHCLCKLRAKYTPDRYPIGLLLGAPRLRHARKECPNCRVVYSSPALEQLLPCHGNYAYDIMIEIGLARFRDYKTPYQIQEELRKNYRRHVPYTTILHLADRFLDGFAAVHDAASDRLREWMLASSGGYVLHLDGTCEAGTSVIFLLVEGQTGLILLAEKMATENSTDIEKMLNKLVSLYGKPLATVRDLSKNIKSARDRVLQGVPDFVCQYHLLAVIGEKLLKPHHDKLKRLQQKFSIRATLTSTRRQLVSRSKDLPPIPHQDFQALLTEPSRELNLSEHQFQRLYFHTLIQWTQDYHADLNREYFPFDLPELAFCRRCQTMLDQLDQWLTAPSLPSRQKKTLESLRKILLPVREDLQLRETIERLEKAQVAFNKCREVLRLKGEDGKPLGRETANPKENAEAAARVDQELEAYRQNLAQLMAQSPDPHIATDAQKVKQKLDEHWDYLHGHAVTVPGLEDSILVQRTNYLPEHKFGARKRGWHRQTGNESLAQVLDSARPEQFLVDNLKNPDYVEFLYRGDLANMPGEFAKVWSEAREIHTKQAGKVTKRLYVPKEFLRSGSFFALMQNGLATAHS